MGSSREMDTVARSVAPNRSQKTAILVAQRIVRDIQRSKLQTGSSLPSEREMLDEYKVGRGSLREALRFLELQGVLIIRPGPGGGPTVTAPDSRHLASTLALLMQFANTPFRAIIEARLFLEPITAQLAAERLDEELRAEIRSSVEAMRDAIDDREGFLEENRRFHNLIAWASGNPIFGYLINSLHWITDGTVVGAEYPRKFRKIVLQAHEDICISIEEGDPKKAYAAMSSHMSNTLVYFERNFPHLLERNLAWVDFSP